MKKLILTLSLLAAAVPVRAVTVIADQTTGGLQAPKNFLSANLQAAGGITRIVLPNGSLIFSNNPAASAGVQVAAGTNVIATTNGNLVMLGVRAIAATNDILEGDLYSFNGVTWSNVTAGGLPIFRPFRSGTNIWLVFNGSLNVANRTGQTVPALQVDGGAEGSSGSIITVRSAGVLKGGMDANGKWFGNFTLGTNNLGSNIVFAGQMLTNVVATNNGSSWLDLALDVHGASRFGGNLGSTTINANGQINVDPNAGLVAANGDVLVGLLGGGIQAVFYQLAAGGSITNWRDVTNFFVFPSSDPPEPWNGLHHIGDDIPSAADSALAANSVKFSNPGDSHVYQSAVAGIPSIIENYTEVQDGSGNRLGACTFGLDADGTCMISSIQPFRFIDNLSSYPHETKVEINNTNGAITVGQPFATPVDGALSDNRFALYHHGYVPFLMARPEADYNEAIFVNGDPDGGQFTFNFGVDPDGNGFVLAGGGTFNVKNNSAENVVSFDQSGNAQLNGNLNAGGDGNFSSSVKSPTYLVGDNGRQLAQGFGNGLALTYDDGAYFQCNTFDLSAFPFGGAQANWFLLSPVDAGNPVVFDAYEASGLIFRTDTYASTGTPRPHYWQINNQNLMTLNTNALSVFRMITTNGVLLHSNSLANIPPLDNGDNFYWPSNGVPHVIWKDQLGTQRTNRLVP